VRGGDGGDGWSYRGEPPKHTFGLEATGAVSQQTYAEYKTSGLRWEEIPLGNYDGSAHIKDNERDGVDAAALYPSAVIEAYDDPDREVAVACVRAYNDWLIDDFCSVDPQRLLALPFVPVNDGIGAAVAEAERAIGKGAKGLCLPLPITPFHDTMYDPLWSVAVDAKVPVTIHRVGVSRSPTPGDQVAQWFPSNDDPRLRSAIGVQRFFSSIPTLSNVIMTGLFERYPTLVFIAGEVNCHWVPGLIQELEHAQERNAGFANVPSAPPGGYFGTNIFVTILDDYVGCSLVRSDEQLARTAMYSTDYPHAATLWPRSQEIIPKMTAGMSEASKSNVLAGNAIRAYSLPR
jgi:predicted TIM-barrel fold metal-dependent hydrolase